MTKEQLLALKETEGCDPWDGGWNAAIDRVIQLLGTPEPKARHQRWSAVLGDPQMHGWGVQREDGTIVLLYASDKANAEAIAAEHNALIDAESRQPERAGELAALRVIADKAEPMLLEQRREFPRGDLRDLDELEDALNAWRALNRPAEPT